MSAQYQWYWSGISTAWNHICRGGCDVTTSIGIGTWYRYPWRFNLSVSVIPINSGISLSLFVMWKFVEPRPLLASEAACVSVIFVTNYIQLLLLITHSSWTELFLWCRQLCDTYPRYIYIPATAPTPIVLSSARFRSRGRLPVLSYLHRENQVSSRESGRFTVLPYCISLTLQEWCLIAGTVVSLCFLFTEDVRQSLCFVWPVCALCSVITPLRNCEFVQFSLNLIQVGVQRRHLSWTKVNKQSQTGRCHLLASVIF